MKIAVIGSGYVGLVTGTCLADLGNDVMCVDNDQTKIEKLKQGIMPIYEPDLEEKVLSNRQENRISFSDSVKEAVDFAEIIFIAVGTPTLENGEPDLSSVEHVSKEIAFHMKDYRLIIEKSTVPVRTGNWIKQTIKDNLAHGIEFDVASNPEFLREGSALSDFMHPDRIIIGTDSPRAVSILVKLYETLNAPILVTDIESAELIKHCANAFLAMKISFINAVSQICEKTNADIMKVAKGIGLDRRIGLDFLQAGVGFGGFCFPKDLDAFINLAFKLGYDFKLLKAVKEINHEQKSNFCFKVEKLLGKDLKNKVIGILGLSFKPNTDDLRFSPALEIIKILQDKGAKIKAYDPKSMSKAKEVLDEVCFCKDPYETAQDAEALLIITEWLIFKNLDLIKLKKIMKRALIIDGRNIYDPKRLKKVGFEYYAVGRGENI
ncbi:MAG: UDP-glucose/GDP-mannose dehydrogenase family protein [Armatimonadetes bacterium]|nr:UDP-glucose/GDP-mannose dehydrogenase family protein [Armatimonadota bacterium]